MRTSDETNFILLSVFVGLLYGGWKLLKKFMKMLLAEPGSPKQRDEGSEFKKPFFVKSLTRRRRLDLNRKDDNILSGKLGKKMKRHRKGMFGR